MTLRHFTPALLLLAVAAFAADPLTKQLEIDFNRDVPARSLGGFAARSDGRLLAGPVLENLPAALPADLLWTLQPATQPGRWLVGSGPEGKILSVAYDGAKPAEITVLADLSETHVFALAVLPGGAVLAGTSPQGTLVLVRDGKVAARVALPVDSVLDLAVLPDGSVLAATGNPGKIYRVDLAAFAKAGDSSEKITDTAALATKGVSLFGEIRDRNVRRLALLPDGRVLAGSAPKGNVYAFPAKGGAPLVLLEGRESEVTDLLVQPDGSFYAAITFAGTTGEARVNRPAPPPPPASANTTNQTAATPVPPVPEPEASTPRFAGRSQLVFFPKDGLPDIVVARGAVAFYRLARHGNWLLLAGGEQGELLAYDPAERRSLTLGASVSAQLNGLATVRDGLFLALRNNPAGLARVDFTGPAERRAETRRLDLGTPAELGRLVFGEGTGEKTGLAVAVRTSFGADELEGWTDWTPLQPSDGSWFAAGLRGRHVQLRVSATGPVDAAGLDKAVLHYLPQNRRPAIGEFRILPPNYGLLPAPEQAPQASATLGQFLAATGSSARDEGRGKSTLLNSQVVPQPGAQLVYWTMNDADGDTIAATFSIRPRGTNDWTDLAVRTRDNYAQFDISHLADGYYDTRLVLEELAPRPAADRQRHALQTDALLVDKTPPVIKDVQATAARASISGADALSPLAGAEFIYNNGHKETVEHPADGLLDGRVETFVAEPAAEKVAGATSVEIILYDQAGNSAARRLPLK